MVEWADCAVQVATKCFVELFVKSYGVYQHLLIRSHIVIDDFNVDTANGIPHKSAIVPRVILRPRTRCTVVSAAGFDCSLVEFVDELVV